MRTIELGGQSLTLLPEKAVFLPESNTLLVADAHIGKAMSFRTLGVPVPSGTTAETLAGLSRLVRRLGVRRIVFLGDLLHSAQARAESTLTELLRWRDAHAALELMLVRGNHDLRAGDPPAALGIDCRDEPHRLGGLALCHHPRALPQSYVLAGHLHPCASLGGRANDRLRLPCFWIGPRVGVLPAFGAFTGMHRIVAARGDRVFVVADGNLCELPGVDA
ncbi:MAG: ligase-associated DNA damage response endonuclease PdeM [Rhizobacter sp.]|nr:ligase-associated DNA damage response endonuclease PdeM [Rhizobacter sp.]